MIKASLSPLTQLLRAAVYARYSSDLQSPTSIDDQVSLCRRYASGNGYDVVKAYSDEDVSGYVPLEQRPGTQQLIADAKAGKFDVIIIEAFDRLARNNLEQEMIMRMLEYLGIVFISINDGYISNMPGAKFVRGMRGVMNEELLEIIAAKTHRGQTGQIERGFVIGAAPYGYRAVKVGESTQFVVDDEAAKWVHWIFERYALDGWSAQCIAHKLNELGVTTKKGNTWAVSAIYGNPNKGSGILNNELYIGRYIWNRSQWRKRPNDGKRQRFMRQDNEVIVIDKPELRIIEDELWNAVRSRMGTPRERGGRSQGRPARTLFGGLLKCPKCGGSIIAVNKRLYGCTANKDRGATVCQGIYLSREEVDACLLGAIRNELLSETALRKLSKQVQSVLAERRKGASLAEQNAKARLKEVNTEIDAIINALVEVGVSKALTERLQKKEAERDKLETVASVQKPSQEIDSSAVIKRARQIIDNLQNALLKDPERARKILSDLMGDIRIVSQDACVYAEYDNATEKLLAAAGGVSLNVVADAHNQHDRKRVYLRHARNV